MLKNKKTIVVLIATTVISLSMLAGCTSKSDSTDTGNNTTVQEKVETTSDGNISEYVNKDYITSTEWLKDNLDNKEVLIIDARDPKEYKKGHIKGAVNVTWQQLSDMNGKAGDDKWGTVLEKEQLSEALSKYGIDLNKQIIIYSNKDGWGEDGRIAWTLKNVGYDNVKMLNGGVDLWESKDYELSKEDVPYTPAGVSIKEIKNDINITTDELKDKLDKVKIIDTRLDAEYNGAQKYGEARGGHIKGAISIPFTVFYNADGSIKPQQEIEQVMKDNGISKDDEIVTYCTAGIRSGHMAMVLKMAGYNNVKNYDESYVKWAANAELPVEK